MKKLIVIILGVAALAVGGLVAMYMGGAAPRDLSSVQGRLVGHWEAEGVAGKYPAESLYLGVLDGDSGPLVSVQGDKVYRGRYGLREVSGDGATLVLERLADDAPVAMAGAAGLSLPKKVSIGKLNISIGEGKVSLGKLPRTRDVRVGTGGLQLVASVKLLGKVEVAGKEFRYVNAHTDPKRWSADDLIGWVKQLSGQSAPK